MRINGLHHITAVTADPAANVAFYTGTLGLRLVKRTVNFDDPSAYHLYYGDALGSPGTALTFFHWAGQPAGRPGFGQVTAVAWSVARDTLPFWQARLTSRGVATQLAKRFDAPILQFSDPDGLPLELIGTDAPETPAPWIPNDIPSNAILGTFHSATISLADTRSTARVLSEVMGAKPTLHDPTNGRTRYALGANQPGAWVDLVTQPGASRGRPGAGTVHHIAFRTTDEASEREALEIWRAAGLHPSPQIDRTYFRSIYAREPAGVLFEIATDGPGFAVDEKSAELGTHLMLPPHYEAHRTAIEAALPPLHLP